MPPRRAAWAACDTARKARSRSPTTCRLLDIVAGIRRLLDIVVTDGLSLENGIARLRALISTAVAATNLLKVGDLEARVEALEHAQAAGTTEFDLDPGLLDDAR